LHHYEGMEDPRAKADIERLRAIARTVRDLGLDVGLTSLANEGYANSPRELRADWTAKEWTELLPAHYHVEICPSKPGAMDLELKWLDERLDAFADIGVDYLWLWPYDQGGCTCRECAPWGASGFLRTAEPLARRYKERFPRGRIVLSTWLFDAFTTGEWEGLSKAFAGRRPDWADYLMVDSHGHVPFPTYPLQHGSPGGLPMVNFPEISMHGNNPWGGYGANPYLRRLQRDWDLTRSRLSGGFPYSEGLYEDINKVVFAQFYWDPDKPAAETVREYAAYYFSPTVAEDVAAAIGILDRNLGHSAGTQDGVPRITMGGTEGAEDAYRLIVKADAALTDDVRSSWRWRILYLRALIDFELASHDLGVSERCAAAFWELTELYHADGPEVPDWIRPPDGS